MKVQEFVTNLSNNPQVITSNKSRVESWNQWYEGYVPSFHSYRTYNGTTYNSLKMSSLQIAKKVSEDWADLLFNEKVGITLGDSKSNDNFLKLFDELNCNVVINQGIEWAFAQGTVAFVLTLTQENKLVLECVKSENIFPISFESGRVTECAFISYKMYETKYYAYVSVHQIDKKTGKYTIENGIFQCNDASYDITGATLTNSWTFDTQSEVPWFNVYTPNSLNNFDFYSPFGISVFANCIAELKAIDNAFDAMENEITNGRFRIMVGTEALNIDQDKVVPVFDARDTVFHRLPTTPNDKPMVECIAPQLRVSNFVDALNAALAMFCNKCGLSSDYYTYSKNLGLKTATEVISSNSPMYRRIKKHEIVLERTLKDIVRAIAAASSSFLARPINAEEIFIRFDDSIVQDTDSERRADLIDIKYGILPRYQYRMKWYHEDENTAKAAVDEATEEMSAFQVTEPQIEGAGNNQSVEKDQDLNQGPESI